MPVAVRSWFRSTIGRSFIGRRRDIRASLQSPGQAAIVAAFARSFSAWPRPPIGVEVADAARPGTMRTETCKRTRLAGADAG